MGQKGEPWSLSDQTSKNEGAIAQWTPVEQFQAERNSAEEGDRVTTSVNKLPQSKSTAQGASRFLCCQVRKQEDSGSSLRSAASMRMDFSSLPATPEQPSIGADGQSSKVWNRFEKSAPERWQIAIQLQKQVSDADMQDLSVSEYLGKFADGRWLTFDDPLVEKEFLKDWWVPTHTWLQIILALTSAGLVVVTAMDITGENVGVWQIRAVCRWSAVLFGLTFLLRSGSIASLFKRRNILFFVVLYYFVVLVVSDEERLIQCLAKIGDSHPSGLVGRLVEALKKYDIKQRSDQVVFCRSMVPYLVPQMWFAMVFLRMSFRRSLALTLYVALIHHITSVWLERKIWSEAEGATIEFFCLFWASAAAVYSTRRNEAITRYLFLKHAFKVTTRPKDFGMSGNAPIHPNALHYLPTDSKTSSPSSSSAEMLRQLFMPHEWDMLASSIDFGNFKFHDEDAEAAFLLHLWEGAQKWISWTGWLMSVVFIFLIVLDFSQEGFSFTVLRLGIRLPLLVSFAFYHFLEKNLDSIISKQALLWTNLAAFFVCITLHNPEVVWKFLGKPEYRASCNGGMLMPLTCQVAWVVFSVCLPWKRILALLCVAFAAYAIIGVAFALPPFHDLTSSVWEVCSAMQVVVLLFGVGVHREMLARIHFSGIHREKNIQDEKETGWWAQHAMKSMQQPATFSKASIQKPLSHFSFSMPVSR